MPAARNKTVRIAVRAVAGVALLALVVGWVGPQRMAEQLRNASLPWFIAALACAILANAVSAWRWGLIAHALGLQARLPGLLSSYAQGITVNTVLPGATLGGDALRSVQLARMHPSNDGLVAAASVVLDRASGLWVLCVVSLIAAIGLVAVRPEAVLGGRIGGLSLPLIAAMAAVLLVALALPFVIRPGRDVAPAGWRKRLQEIRALVHAKRVVLAKSLLPSAGVQVLSAATLWLCLRAGGGDDPGYLAVLVVAAPVFLAAAVPVSVGGFGPREAAAALTFPWVGASAEAGVAAALLYGLTAAAQGVLAAPLLAARTRSDRAAPTATKEEQR